VTRYDSIKKGPRKIAGTFLNSRTGIIIF